MSLRAFPLLGTRPTRTRTSTSGSPTTVGVTDAVGISWASAEKPDSQNRITIPPPLRAYAGLERDLVVTGVGAHAEIWNATAWNTYAEANEENYAELEQEVIPGLF